MFRDLETKKRRVNDIIQLLFDFDYCHFEEGPCLGIEKLIKPYAGSQITVKQHMF